MKLACITATIGRSKYLTRSMESAQAIGFDKHYLITSDHCIPELTARFPHASVISERRDAKGLYAALNQIIPLLPQDITWVVFLNDDDILLPDAKSFYRETERAGADVGIARTVYIGADDTVLFEAPFWPFASGMRELCEQGIVPFLQVATVVRAQLLRDLQGFDTSYRVAADLDFFLRCFTRTDKVYVSRQVVAGFRVVGGQLSGNAELLGQETCRTIRKNQVSNRPLWRIAFRFLYRIINMPTYVSRLLRYRKFKTRDFYSN